MEFANTPSDDPTGRLNYYVLDFLLLYLPQGQILYLTEQVSVLYYTKSGPSTRLHYNLLRVQRTHHLLGPEAVSKQA